MLLHPISTVWVLCFIPSIPMTAMVPIIVAISAASSAMEKVFTSAPRISLLWNISPYHFRLNRVNTDMDFASLNDSTISVSIGRYRNSMIITMYRFPKNFFI